MKVRIVLSILFLGIVLSGLDAQIFLGNYRGADSQELNGRFHFEMPFGIPITLRKFNDQHKIFITPSYIFSDTYLNGSWVFETDGAGNTSYFRDPDPAHTYKPSLASYQSKIRTWKWEMKLGYALQVGKVDLEVAYAPQYIQTGSFRRKFVEGNEVVKARDRFKDKADFYNIQRLQHRVYTTMVVYGIGLQAYTNITSFFKNSTDIDLQKFGVTLAFRIRNMNLSGGKDGKDGQDGKNAKNAGNELEMKQMRF